MNHLGLHAWPLIPPAWQFGVTRMNYTTILWLYIRHLDATNSTEQDVLMGMQRISSELIQAGFFVNVPDKAIKQVSFNAN